MSEELSKALIRLESQGYGSEVTLIRSALAAERAANAELRAQLPSEAFKAGVQKNMDDAKALNQELFRKNSSLSVALEAETAARKKAEEERDSHKRDVDRLKRWNDELVDTVEDYKRAGAGDEKTKEALDYIDAILAGDGLYSHALVIARALRAAWKQLDDVTRERDARQKMVEIQQDREIELTQRAESAEKALEAMTKERDDYREGARVEAAEGDAAREALAREHENFLAVHRDNMALVNRNAELLKALDVAVGALESVLKVCVRTDGLDMREFRDALALIKSRQEKKA